MAIWNQPQLGSVLTKNNNGRDTYWNFNVDSNLLAPMFENTNMCRALEEKISSLDHDIAPLNKITEDLIIPHEVLLYFVPWAETRLVSKCRL